MKYAATCLMGVLGLAAALAASQTASADVMPASGPGTPTVLYSQSSLVQGSTANVTTLSAPGAGELFLTLTDLDFTDPFSSLKFSLTNTSSALVGLADPGTLTLDLTKPTTLYADVFGTAGASNVGLYNLTATFLTSSPVPLPASGWLLGGALVAGLLARRGLARRLADTLHEPALG